jgi:hypothetical protein
MHPMLVAALAEDRRRRCPCGAATYKPCRLCHGCCQRRQLELRDRAAAPSQRSPLKARQNSKALPFARVLSLLQDTRKGTQG